MASPSRVPDLPTSFGKYILCERIGKGGMAEIFRATVHGASGFLKELVIKRMLPSLTNDPGFADVIVREAKIAVTLRHQNIVQVFELGEVDGQYYIAMEYIHGRDLRAVLARCAEEPRKLPIGLGVLIGLEVCRALDYAHNVKGATGKPLELVHRDISPTNLMASFAGEVKVLDFGIAKAEVAEYVTREGLIKGNCPYMSPEQIAGRAVNHRSDLFSLGSTLYELLTSRRAFEAPSQIAIMQRIYAEPCEPPSAYRPEIPPALDEVVMRFLAKDPDQRYPDAAAAHDALQALVGKSVQASSSFELSTFLKALFGEESSRESRSLPPEGETQQSRGILAQSESAARHLAASPAAEPRLLPDDPVDMMGSTKPMPVRPGSGPHAEAPMRLELEPGGTRQMDERQRAGGAPAPRQPAAPSASASPTDTRRITTRPPTAGGAAPRPRPWDSRRWLWVAVGGAAIVLGVWKLGPGLSGTGETRYRPRPDRQAPRQSEPAAPVPEPRQDPVDGGASAPEPAKVPDAKLGGHARPAAATATGKLRLSCDPWADVTIDGRRIPKQTPLLDYPIPVGVRVLTLSHPGFRSERLTIRVAPNETVFRRVVLEREERRSAFPGGPN